MNGGPPESLVLESFSMSFKHIQERLDELGVRVSELEAIASADKQESLLS